VKIHVRNVLTIHGKHQKFDSRRAEESQARIAQEANAQKASRVSARLAQTQSEKDGARNGQEIAVSNRR
jgi:hypothetical protein